MKNIDRYYSFIYDSITAKINSSEWRFYYNTKNNELIKSNIDLNKSYLEELYKLNIEERRNVLENYIETIESKEYRSILEEFMNNISEMNSCLNIIPMLKKKNLLSEANHYFLYFGNMILEIAFELYKKYDLKENMNVRIIKKP